ncbi:MAG: hypothetical protein DELT_01391 [Desulfovibrio sp.]
MGAVTKRFSFTASIAGLNTRVHTDYPEIQSVYHCFLSESGHVDFEISVSEDLFAFAAEMHGGAMPGLLPWHTENLALQYLLCQCALRHGCLLIHASSLQLDGKAYLFSAPSGTGKSTHSRLWVETFEGRASMINDDMPLLRRLDGRWLVCGTPWTGKHGLGFNCTAPLKALGLLRRGNNTIRSYAQQEDFPYLLNQVLRPNDSDLMDLTFALLEQLLTEVPVWSLFCEPTQAAAIMAANAMKEQKYED